MDTKVFVEKKAGDYFNNNFINLKFDMESAEGKEINKILNVSAFPTYFIVRPDGKIQHTLIGGSDIDSFISRVKEGANFKTSIMYLKEQYAAGKLSLEEKTQLFKMANNVKDKELEAEIKEELLTKATDEEKMKKEYWPLMTERSQNYFDTENFNFVIDNIKTFKKNVGEDVIDNYTYNIFKKFVGYYIIGNIGGGSNDLDKNQTAKVRKCLKVAKLDKEKTAEILSKCDFADARRDGDIDKMIAIMKKDYKHYDDTGAWGIASSYIMAADNKPITDEQRKGISEVGEIFIEREKGTKENIKDYFNRL